MAKTKTADAGGEKTNRGKKPTERPTLEKLQSEIAARANEIYLRRIGSNESGDQLSDWLHAESDIKSK
jgi:hypothetical protein